MNQQLALGDLPPGRHERTLEHRRELTRSTITAADRAHARHADQCPICTDNAQSFHALLGVLDRTEEARRTLVLGLRQMIGHRSAPSTWTTYAKKLAATADREWRKHAQTIRKEDGVARLLAAQHAADQAEATADGIDRQLDAIRASADGVTCTRCGMSPAVARTASLPDLVDFALRHIRTCSKRPNAATPNTPTGEQQP